MKKRLRLLAILLILLLGAGADHQFLLDSDTRLIAAGELWLWDRE